MILNGKFPPYDEIFNHLVKVVSSERFLNKQGLGKEVPFFIFPFSPEDALRNEDDVINVIKKLKVERGIEILHLNLYKICIEMLKERDVFDSIIEDESSYEKDDLLDMLQSLLDPESNLIPKIREIIADKQFDVAFITGVGEIYPYIRSHTVLNNLQSTIEEQPTVMFFPGSYSHSDTKGASLDLFNIMPGDRYYRAFNLLDYQI